jgi:hypothetical protein
MPTLGISVYLLAAICCAVHAVRTGRNLIWLFVLFSFPLLGSLVYFTVEWLPGLRGLPGPRGGSLLRGAAGQAQGLINSQRGVRAARVAFAQVASPENRLRLARALLGEGATSEAVAHFEACLNGPAGNDPEIRHATAEALLADGQAVRALSLASALRTGTPTFHPERTALLIARARAAEGDRAGAHAEFGQALERFGGTEVRARYAIFAAQAGDHALARRLQAELLDAQKTWPRHTRMLNRGLMRELGQALRAPRAAD